MAIGVPVMRLVSVLPLVRKIPCEPGKMGKKFLFLHDWLKFHKEICPDLALFACEFRISLIVTSQDRDISGLV